MLKNIYGKIFLGIQAVFILWAIYAAIDLFTNADPNYTGGMMPSPFEIIVFGIIISLPFGIIAYKKRTK